MKRREFLTTTALSGLVVTLPAVAGTITLPAADLDWSCIRLGNEQPVEPAATTSWRIDMLGADGPDAATRPGLGLSASFGNAWTPRDYILIHPVDGDLQRTGQVHFTGRSLAGLEAELDGHRAHLPRTALFGRRLQPGDYRLTLRAPTAEPVTLRLRLVAI